MSDSVLIYDLNKAAAELCRRDFSFFVKEFWDVIIAEDLVWEPHMDVLCSEMQGVIDRIKLQPDPNIPEQLIRLEKLQDILINIPPGTTKSTIVTIMLPAWAWTVDASLRIITASYSDTLAVEHSTKSREIIQSDKYRLYFPEVQIKDHKGLKSNYETTSNGQRFATSVGGTVTGVHAHLIIVDDPLNAAQAISKKECQTANDWLDKTLSMRKVDKRITVTVLIMQRLSVNDCTAHLLNKKKVNVKHICLPAELSSNVSPEELRGIYKDGLLSPVRLARAQLDEALKDLGSSGFAGQMGQRPAPEGGTIWQSDWFRIVPDHLFPKEEETTHVGTDWDLAYTKEDRNSASAFVKTGMIYENIYLLDFDWQWLEFPDLIRWMKSVGGPHYIEAKASGKSAKQTLKQQGVIAVEVKVTSDKIARAKDATPTVEAGHVYIRQSMSDRLFNDQKQGILFFPNGENNDLADVLSQAITRRSKSGKIHVANINAESQQPEKENLLDYIS